MRVSEEQLNELYKRVSIACNNFPQLRYGQAMFNEACSMWPNFVNTLRGSDDDCFYDDAKVENFLSHFEVN